MVEKAGRRWRLTLTKICIVGRKARKARMKGL